jgi:hypothetical protein
MNAKKTLTGIILVAIHQTFGIGARSQMCGNTTQRTISQRQSNTNRSLHFEI